MFTARPQDVVSGFPQEPFKAQTMGTPPEVRQKRKTYHKIRDKKDYSTEIPHTAHGGKWI